MRAAGLTVVLALAAAACTGPGADAPPVSSTLVVHSHQNPTNGLVNQFLVETETGVVAIDAGFLDRDVDVVEAMIDSIGKPLEAILVTHAHLDHTNGVGRLSDGGRIPAYAAARTIREHETHDYTTRLPHLRPLYPPGEAELTPVETGFVLELDGLTFRLLELGPGESEWDAVWVVEGRDDPRAFVGDLLLNRVHGFFQSGRSTEWIASLDELLRILPVGTEVYAGHGEPVADLEALAWQRDYIQRVRAEVASLADGSPTLDPEQERRLYEEVSGWLPSNRLEFLILLGADVVASELALEAERRRIDEKLAALGGA